MGGFAHCIPKLKGKETTFHIITLGKLRVFCMGSEIIEMIHDLKCVRLRVSIGILEESQRKTNKNIAMMDLGMKGRCPKYRRDSINCRNSQYNFKVPLVLSKVKSGETTLVSTCSILTFELLEAISNDKSIINSPRRRPVNSWKRKIDIINPAKVTHIIPSQIVFARFRHYVSLQI
jgi:hypothetical protein